MRSMSVVSLVAVSLSSLVVSLAQPNDLFLLGQPWLTLVGWVPLFWALRNSTSNRMAAGMGALFGLLTTLMQDYWLAYFQDYAIWTIAGPALGLTGYGALLGPVLRTFLRLSHDARPFAVGAVWATFEFLKSNGFLGFPWGLAAYPLHQWPVLLQVLDLTGIGFLTFLVISVNAWLSELIDSHARATARGGLFLVMLVSLTAGYGYWSLGHPLVGTKQLNLLLVQQNSDPWRSGDDLAPLQASVKESLAGLKTGSPDLVVWSETALRYPLQEWRPYYERNPAKSPLFKVIRANKPYWLFGNPYFQDYDPEKKIRGGGVNATVLMNPQAQIVDYYGKIQQVPFAEYIPYWEVPAVQSFFIHAIGLAGSWELGRQLTVFQVPVGNTTVHFSTPICFEDAFPWINRAMVAKGAEVLINLTNDSWSHRDSSQNQHFVASLFRAVENRVPLVRSTNTGVTCIVGSDGIVLAGPLPSFQAGHLNVQLSLPALRPLTVYNQCGDWLIAFFASLLVLVLLGELRRSRP